ncbi:Predicted arabinose efflux permease, MFS family [Lentzea waywayandensis]|uniref:Predicted arabinose efflux permease, MFS family n=1 Tax=Lentzea waywayandensis TaxID=84724 RepID=A0A1I6F818_9PSEU|nr:Predicted arabinose efflux permease, MFS family [Lentzea waywayandensis]
MVLASATLTIMAAAIIAPSLPAMGEVYGEGVLVRLALTITSLAIAVSAPLAGLVADRTGRKPLLTASLALYAVAGTAGYFVTSLPVLLGTRTLLGLAVGGVMTAVSALITDWFEGPERGRFLGFQQAAASLGGVVFLPLAGVLAGIDWRLPFWLYSVAAVIALAAATGLTGERPAPPQAAGGQAFPRKAIGIYLMALIATLVFYMAPTQLPFLLRDLNASPAVIGFVIAGSTLTSVVGALVFPKLKTARITAISVVLLGVGWLVIGYANGVALVTAGLLIGGFGVGLVVPNLNTGLANLARPEQRGRVLSGLVAGIFLGQFLSPLVIAPLVGATSIASAFTWTGVVTTIAGAVLALGHKEKN